MSSGTQWSRHSVAGWGRLIMFGIQGVQFTLHILAICITMEIAAIVLSQKLITPGPRKDEIVYGR